MFNEDEIKQLSFKFLQGFEEGNYAYDDEVSKQTQKHYYKMKTTKQFFNDLIQCSELKHYSKEIQHLLTMIQTSDYIKEKQLQSQIRVLKKQIDTLNEKCKGHTRFTCPQCNSNIKDMAKKWNDEYIQKNNLQTYRDQIDRQSYNLSQYNITCRRLEKKISEKDDLIIELKSKITELKTAHIHDELDSKKKNKKKKKTSSKKDKKKLLKLLAQQLNDSSSEEESSSSDEEY
jgi:hypothetical protein